MQTRPLREIIYHYNNLGSFYPRFQRSMFRVDIPPDRFDNGSGFSHELECGPSTVYSLQLLIVLFQVVKMDQADRMECSRVDHEGGSEWTTDGRNDRNVRDNHCVTESPMIKMIDFVTINNYPVSGYGDASSVSSSSR